MAQPDITFQYDITDNIIGRFRGDIEKLTSYGFEYFDKFPGAINTVLWDCCHCNYSVYPSKVLPENPYEPYKSWSDTGFDFTKYIVEQSRERSLDCLWNFRMSEVDNAGLTPREKEIINPVKTAHPDWLLKTWWPLGMWDYSNPDLRQWRADIILELAENYDFDGFQIDFCRHTPYLPVGKQWELRDDLTDFLSLVRNGLNDIGNRK